MPMMKCHLSPFVRTINKAGLVASPVCTVLLSATGQLGSEPGFDTWLTVGVTLCLAWLMGMTVAAVIVFAYQLEEGRQLEAEERWKRRHVYGGVTRAQFEDACRRRRIRNLALCGVEPKAGARRPATLAASSGNRQSRAHVSLRSGAAQRTDAIA